MTPGSHLPNVVHTTPLTPETEAVVDQFAHTDILVGIPSFNNVETIGHVVKAVSAGLLVLSGRPRGFGEFGRRVHGWHAAGGRPGRSRPKTLFIGDQQSSLHKIITPYHGIPVKGSAFRTIFEIARRLKAKACAVVDSTLRSITRVD